jgi:adenosylhomocysteine nucleosidase
MQKIVIVSALDEEIKLAEELKNTLLKANFEVYLTKCGIGKVNAAIATYKAIKEYEPDYVISFGLAGCLRQNFLNIGNTIVLAKQAFYWDAWCGEPNICGQIQGFPLFYPCVDNQEISDAIINHFSKEYNVVKGFSVATSDKFADKPWYEEDILEIDYLAGAVDMEAAAVAQVCHMENTAFIACKIISDYVGQENQMDEYLKIKHSL